MSKKTGKRFSLLLTAALSFGLLAGCGGGTSNSTVESGNTQEGTYAKPVELQVYMLGNAPKDMGKVEAELNKMAKEDLNTTVHFNYTTWTDWDQKYKLLLSTGQNIDLIYTADWTQYSAYAKRGAFLPLDDLLPKAAPELQKFVPEDMWNAVRVDSKIYTVPSTYKEYVTPGFVYREDLRAKYDLPVPKDLASYEEYMAGIKANEPDMMPAAFTSAVDAVLADTYQSLNGMIGAMPYGIGIKQQDPANVYSYWGSDEHKKELSTFRRWQEAGYISKNVLNSKDSAQDLVSTGKAASMFGDNPNRYSEMLSQMQANHPDWDLGYTPFAETLGYAMPVHPVHNGFAVPTSSKNPERALAFYEKLVLDKRYNQLTEYGFEGTNYTVENGYYKMVGTAETNGFPREAMNGWAWRNPDYMLFDKSYDKVKEIFAELDKVQTPDLFTGFAEDYSTYAAERAALEQVEKQYLYPLEAGLVEDVEGGLANFMQKAKQAGLEKIQAEYKKQWETYLQKAGIQ
ncbi:extracellular solute-binding protein [Saccharibacillus sacchari]|uniref:Extracellular solute-binding protein n=1 Tax=Saccharibacillus sacchari TaxID=456493 RepID=A0ACC6PIE0_9BACL